LFIVIILLVLVSKKVVAENSQQQRHAIQSKEQQDFLSTDEAQYLCWCGQVMSQKYKYSHDSMSFNSCGNPVTMWGSLFS
jgi:hypothetical protein